MFKYTGSYKKGSEMVQYYDDTPITICSNEFGIHDFLLRISDAERIQDHYTIHYVLRGKGTLTLTGKVHPAKKGDVFVTPPGVSVTTTPDKDDPWRYFWFGFNGKDAATLIREAKFSLVTPIFSTQHGDQIEQIINNLMEEIDLPKSPQTLFALSALIKIFAIVAQEREKENELLKEAAESSKYLQYAITDIEQNYSDEKYTIDDTCKNLSISHSYLCKIFEKYSLVTARQYLIQYRLARARVLLEDTKDSVQSIVLACGFSDQAHFTKQFKKHFLLTPLAYRAMAQKSSL